MWNKRNNTDYDISEQELTDRELAQQGNYSTDYESADGAWITSEEQLEQMQKAVSDLEKRLRS